MGGRVRRAAGVRKGANDFVGMAKEARTVGQYTRGRLEDATKCMRPTKRSWKQDHTYVCAGSRRPGTSG